MLQLIGVEEVYKSVNSRLQRISWAYVTDEISSARTCRWKSKDIVSLMLKEEIQIEIGC